jgi:protein TonB
MSDERKPAVVPPPKIVAGDRVKSFLGWAFLISILLHAVTLPFFGLKARAQEKQEVEKVSVTKKIRVTPPTPPPPTPPPPTPPPPKQTPPPVKQTAPPPQVKLKLNVVKTHSKDTSPSTETKYVPPPVGNENGNPNGVAASGPPAVAPVAATAAPATPTPTPKPQCANPNEDASIKGDAVNPDYPDIARQQGAIGTTEVKVTLDASGDAVDVSVYKSSGNVALDASALKAAKATQYNAETVNCVKTAGSYIFRADFTGE